MTETAGRPRAASRTRRDMIERDGTRLCESCREWFNFLGGGQRRQEDGPDR
jgi:hypothetical protein